MGDSELKIDIDTLQLLNKTLQTVEYGEIILIIHNGEVKRIDVKNRIKIK